MITSLRRHLAVAVTVVLTTILLAPVPSFASPEIAKKEGLKCTVCHDKAGSKLLTSKGKYYEYMKTLTGYDDVIHQYKKCTTCHSKEPGNATLTKKGEDLKARGETMKHIARPESH
jgi:hypothetical protein